MIRLARALRLAPLLLAAALAGCGIYTDVPDAGPPSASPPAPPEALRPPTESTGGRVMVRSGQTLYAVSREQGVPVRALIDANGLAPPYGLRAGQILVVPRIRQYVVQPGDTLHDVARRFGVETATLVRLNHLAAPYVIRIGLPLILPPRPAMVVAEGETPPFRAAEPARLPAAPLAVPASPAPTASPSRPPAGAPAPARFDAVALPPPAATARPTPPRLPESLPRALEPPAAPSAATAMVHPMVPPAKPSRVAPPPEPESGAPSPAESGMVAPAVAAIVANHRPPTAPLFYWPVRGTVLSAFGEAAGGTHNDGINIAAPEGTEVDAAAAGTVAYAGDELRGFGNLLLIKHADGWITAYAHNKTLLVKKGEHVRRGQAIATVGSSGGVGRPQLHFELRQGTKAIDPLDHLPPPGEGAG